ncbi:hypothetical protein Hanom_Chr11g00997831 [Helianthus anomalus]
MTRGPEVESEGGGGYKPNPLSLYDLLSPESTSTLFRTSSQIILPIVPVSCTSCSSSDASTSFSGSDLRFTVLFFFVAPFFAFKTLGFCSSASMSDRGSSNSGSSLFVTVVAMRIPMFSNGNKANSRRILW